MSFSISQNFYVQIKQYGCFKFVHFSKNLAVSSSAGPKILAFGSHCSANFQLILHCFIPNFKLKYEYSENIKADGVNTVFFNLHQIKPRAFWFFLGGGHPVEVQSFFVGGFFVYSKYLK